MDWVSILQAVLIFVGHQLMRLTLGDVPKLIFGFIAVWFRYFWTSPESESLRRYLGPIFVEAANGLFMFFVLYFGYDFFYLIGGYMRDFHNYAAAPLMRRVFGVSRVRATPAELDSTIRRFRARVDKKLESLKGKLRNHPDHDRLVDKISRIQSQCAEMLNPEFAHYREHCVRHIDTCLRILHDDVSAFIRGQPRGRDLTILNNDYTVLTKKITDVKQNLEQGVIPPEEPHWPPKYPLIQHNIANAIPLHLQKLQCAAFTTWLGIIACLFWNIIAVTTAWIGGEGGLEIWLLAILYFTVGAPASYLWWYRPLYRILSSESPGTLMNYGWFLKYMIHILFCFVAALASTSKSLTGIYTTLDVLDNFWVANLYSVGFQMFMIEALLSVWVLKQVCLQWRDASD